MGGLVVGVASAARGLVADGRRTGSDQAGRRIWRRVGWQHAESGVIVRRAL